MDIVYRAHALRRMLERGIDEGSVRSAIESGDVISSYPDDTPYPTFVFPGGSAAGPCTWSQPIIAPTIDGACARIRSLPIILEASRHDRWHR